MTTAVDSSVLLDVLGADPRFGEKSREALRAAYDRGALVACDVVWAKGHAHFHSEGETKGTAGRTREFSVWRPGRVDGRDPL